MTPSAKRAAASPGWGRAVQALVEALDPRSLTKNQRFTLPGNLFMLAFGGMCLHADLDSTYKFILGLAILALLAWSHYLNLKS